MVWSRCLRGSRVWVSGSLQAWPSRLGPERGWAPRRGRRQGPPEATELLSEPARHPLRTLTVLKAVLHPLPVPPGPPTPLRATSHPSPTPAPGPATLGLPSSPPQAAWHRGPWSEALQALSPAGPRWLCSRTQLSGCSHRGRHLLRMGGRGRGPGMGMVAPRPPCVLLGWS